MRTILATLFIFVTVGVAHADPAADLADQASKLHREAQKTKEPQKYESAHQLYQQYLRQYPAGAVAAEIAYFDAELEFARQHYDEAARLYDQSITREPKGKYTQEAAYALVISVKNAAHLDDHKVPDAGAPCPPPPTVCTITPDFTRMLAAFDRYLAVVAQSEERPNIEYRRARIYYEFNQLDKAAPLFDAIVARYPQHELAVYSANLEMDCLAILKRYDQLRGLVARLKKSPVMHDATVREQVEQMEKGLKKKP
ncbi:MAG: Tetratricopeptide repeat protein [Myxococcales bacterium]|nr:Tetratricopeptide repeat protein [Myxococcales bacterium]